MVWTIAGWRARRCGDRDDGEDGTADDLREAPHEPEVEVCEGTTTETSESQHRRARLLSLSAPTHAASTYGRHPYWVTPFTSSEEATTTAVDTTTSCFQVGPWGRPALRVFADSCDVAPNDGEEPLERHPIHNNTEEQEEAEEEEPDVKEEAHHYRRYRHGMATVMMMRSPSQTSPFVTSTTMTLTATTVSVAAAAVTTRRGTGEDRRDGRSASSSSSSSSSVSVPRSAPSLATSSGSASVDGGGGRRAILLRQPAILTSSSSSSSTSRSPPLTTTPSASPLSPCETPLHSSGKGVANTPLARAAIANHASDSRRSSSPTVHSPHTSSNKEKEKVATAAAAAAALWHRCERSPSLCAEVVCTAAGVAIVKASEETTTSKSAVVEGTVLLPSTASAANSARLAIAHPHSTAGGVSGSQCTVDSLPLVFPVKTGTAAVSFDSHTGTLYEAARPRTYSPDALSGKKEEGEEVAAAINGARAAALKDPSSHLAKRVHPLPSYHAGSTSQADERSGSATAPLPSPPLSSSIWRSFRAAAAAVAGDGFTTPFDTDADTDDDEDAGAATGSVRRCSSETAAAAATSAGASKGLACYSRNAVM